jgi:hypothetical protein
MYPTGLPVIYFYVYCTNCTYVVLVLHIQTVLGFFLFYCNVKEKLVIRERRGRTAYNKLQSWFFILMIVTQNLIDDDNSGAPCLYGYSTIEISAFVFLLDGNAICTVWNCLDRTANPVNRVLIPHGSCGTVLNDVRSYRTSAVSRIVYDTVPYTWTGTE